ncbi:MAG: hypothetical protein PVH29_13305 [Candidatus Zixiibacteriota bacterium]|jgi:uridine phosphorylase
MSIVNRVKGGVAAAYLANSSRAQKVARAELGCTAVAPVVLLPVSGQMTKRLVGRLRRSRRDGDIYQGTLDGRDVSVINTGVGTPSAEGKVFACLGVGARVLLRFDICGGLEDDMRVGDIIVAARAVPLDNATLSLAGDAPIPASPLLLDVVREAIKEVPGGRRGREAAVATVDTFHHQTDEMHREWGRRAAAVDMETSIIYELGRRAGAHALAVMAVSDVRLSGLDPFGDDDFPYGDLYQSFDDLAELAAGCVAGLPASLPGEE